ncbi:hypothetical protein PQX77_008835 [Marasmius sp. AFHP31]|nr:hypothetical protein PQX77_008835 [Marasmius sp. AFHP31]
MLTLDIHADRDLEDGEVWVISEYAQRIGRLIVNPYSHIYLTGAIFSQLKAVTFPRLQQFDYRADSVPGSLLRVMRDVDAGGEAFSVPYTRNQKILWNHWSFGDITKLTLGFLRCPIIQPDYMETWAILNGCRRSLVVLEYYGMSPMRRNGDELQEAIGFPRLQSLVLGYTGDLYLIISLIRAPQLEELTIRNIVDCPPNLELNYYPTRHIEESLSDVDLFASFTELRHTSVPRLKALHLFGCKAEYTDLMSFLPWVPKLHTLTLYAIAWPHERRSYFDALLESDTERLRKLTISSGSKYYTTRYLKQRKTPLEDFVIARSGYKALDWVEILKKAGTGEDDAGCCATKGSPRDSSLEDTTRGARNVWVIEDPVNHECVSLKPVMQPVIGGILVYPRGDVDSTLD